MIDGLTGAEAARRLAEQGPNAIVEPKPNAIGRVLRRFRSPVSKMLVLTILVQLAMGEWRVALVVAALLTTNIALGSMHEARATATLDLLKQRLSPRARVRRDGAWLDRSSADLVTGDVVQLSLGGIVPADVRIDSGQILLDRSMLTGESTAIEAGPGALAYAGAPIRRGAAIGTTVATGTRTFLGRTAELVRIAHVQSGEQKAVVSVVGALTIVNIAIVVGMTGYALLVGMGVPDIVALTVTAMLSSVPVALPATFTLAATLGARRLAQCGVLLTRLDALHDAAGIDVLCVDKTGTLTENALTVGDIWAVRDGLDVLALAAIASTPDGQDPIDAAILAAAPSGGWIVSRFVPFDPATRTAEALATAPDGRTIRAVKGAPDAIDAIAPLTAAARSALGRFTAAGYRTLAVAAGPPDAIALAGLIAFGDPPRADSAALLSELRALGVKTVMVTGDAAGTAAAVARAIGLDGPVCPPGRISDNARPDDYAVYAGVFPEDKFRLVQAFQRAGHIVGMCGDGANDAPALRQAQVGIAVSSATDVAKSAAGMVLTEPGLGGIVACIHEGRSSFQRVMTYTLSLLVNKCSALIVMAAGLAIVGQAVLSPMLQAFGMLTADFVTMSRAADRAQPSAYPNRWRVRNLTLAAIPLGLFKLAFSVSMLALGWYYAKLDPDRMQTLTFLLLMLTWLANIYVMRERGHFWDSRPAPIMLLASLANLAVVAGCALGGILMAALPATIVLALCAATVGFAFVLDVLKIAVFRHFRID